MRPPPAHRGTTAHIQAAYPFMAEAGLGGRGPLVGRDLFGGSFFFDPWALYEAGVLTNPNILVIGQVGRGKSALVKTYLWRQVGFGRQAWVVDPKGEYGALAAACGSEPLRLEPGGPLRLNPLELPSGLVGPGGGSVPRCLAGGSARSWQATQSVEPGLAGLRPQVELLGALACSCLGRALGPAERTALELGIKAAFSREPRPALPDVVAALLDPDPALAASVRTSAAQLAADGRLLALELRRLVEGDLAGMFDGCTSAVVDLEAPVVVLDLSAVFTSPALGVLMTCATAWLQSLLAARAGVKRLVVVDEAWAVLSDLGTARWLQAGFKLARTLGVAHVAVVHRLSDLRAAGEASSVQRQLAEGLLADSETRVVFGQSPSELEAASKLLGLTSTEGDLVPQLPRGTALWKVGGRSFLVEHRLAAGEAELVDTDSAMRLVGPQAAVLAGPPRAGLADADGATGTEGKKAPPAAESLTAVGAGRPGVPARRRDATVVAP